MFLTLLRIRWLRLMNNLSSGKKSIMFWLKVFRIYTIMLTKFPMTLRIRPLKDLVLLVVKKVSDGYRIITGNFVHVENIDKLEEKIKRINRSSHEEIKELYKFILNHQRISAKGGGGLGLVDIARKTGNKLEYSFKEYNDDYSFFYLDILVNEEK